MSEEIIKDFKLVEVDPVLFYGINDRNLRIIEQNFSVTILGRGENVKISGNRENVILVNELLEELVFLINRNKKLSRTDLMTAIQIIKGESNGSENIISAKDDLSSVVLFTDAGYIKPRSDGQQKYFDAVKNNDIVFCIGPAGTGKTYLAVSLAVAHLKNKLASKIILARPAVEAGESLGFLPGDFREKIDPYLRPLYDALIDVLPREVVKSHMEKGIIEVIPMAFMRGRTLNNAFVLLDEAQNCTFLQMKMFLTRLGNNSKSIVNGDITQIDLPDKTLSGLVSVQDILKNIEGIKFVYMSSDDVVRHKLVKQIINAYSNRENNKNKNKK